jgi:hypothetical protein
MMDNKLLCGNADGQQDLRSVSIQADKPSGFVDKEKWLAHGGRFSHGADGCRCCEAAHSDRADCTQTRCTAAHTGRRKTVPTTPCALLCAPGTGRATSLPLTAVSAPFGRFTGDERKSRIKPRGRKRPPQRPQTPAVRAFFRWSEVGSKPGKTATYGVKKCGNHEISTNQTGVKPWKGTPNEQKNEIRSLSAAREKSGD